MARFPLLRVCRQHHQDISCIYLQLYFCGHIYLFARLSASSSSISLQYSTSRTRSAVAWNYSLSSTAEQLAKSRHDGV